MPPPRKLSPRRKSRRSRSRSYSPKQSHRRRSRSRSPKRRSRSPHKKHGKSKRSHSRSPHRKSPSPHYPVKRPADSSGKRSSHRSHSRSRTPPKKSRDDRYHKESSPKYSMSKKPRSPSPRRRSPSPQPRRHSPVQQTRRRSTSPQTRRHSPSPRQSASSSYSNTYPKKEQLFAVGKKHKEIDLVKIVDQGPKERLDKRFQTLEQLAQGAFDFEENITIGIHRGPHHMELDEDVPVSYDFNPKTFIMLFPKKDSSRPIFDRDEIKAFHHDDVLDEEAYVEKRTITVKPSEKQRPKWMDDYKITVGQDRSNYEDRRMVQDSRSRRHRSRSRSPGYSHQEVKVRLDPKPDPRYERIYRDQQRQEESILSYDSAPRTPHDLRYSLNKRKSDDIGPPRDRDRDDRGRDMDRGSKFDARSRIQARRQDSFSGDRMSDRRDQRDRDTRDSRDQRISRDSPGRSFGDKRRYSDVKTALPDFKNRPDKFRFDTWKENPEEIPKSAEYYEHDNRSRDDMNYWERKQMFLKTGQYPGRGGARGRGFRGSVRGNFRGNPRGTFSRGRGFRGIVKKRYEPGFSRRDTNEEWKHDKFSELEDSEENGKSSPEFKSKDKKSRESKHRTKKETKNEEKEADVIRKEEENMQCDVNVEIN